jgi:hypothetical protein
LIATLVCMIQSGNMTEDLERLFKSHLDRQSRSLKSLPPVKQWTTQLCGDIDIVINRQGTWLHEGIEIKRSNLVKFFSSLLLKDGTDYFLITPEEKWRITVELAPFLITRANRACKSGHQIITLSTYTDELIVISDDHPLWIEYEQGSDEPIPLVLVRDGMAGLLSRNVFYELVSWGLLKGIPGRLVINSMGIEFDLGIVE